jgi:predicted phage terminase large subunit-like protein
MTLIADALHRHFTNDQITQLAHRQIDSDFRRELGEIDWIFFCQYYLPRHFNKPFGNLHLELFDDFSAALSAEQQTHEVIAFPREHGKTTCVSLACALYAALYQKRFFIILLAQEHGQSKDYLSDIKAELESNDRILEDFGDLVGVPWQATEIRLNSGVRIKPLGARMKLRGRKERHQRPDLIIADDLEDIVTAQNEAEREARKTWVLRTVLRAGTDNTAFFFVGNKIHNDGVVAMLLDNPLFKKRNYKAIQEWPTNDDLWDEWRNVLSKHPGDSDRGKHEAHNFYADNEDALLEGAVVGWPEGMPLYNLMLALAIGGRSAFYAEMQNEPVAPGDRIFTYHTYQTRLDTNGEVTLQPTEGGPITLLSQCKFFYAVDPSLGQKRSDPTGIICLARAPTGQLFVWLVDVQRRPPYKTIEAIQSHHLKYPVCRCALEVVQFQALFATDAARESMQTGTYINYVQVPARSNKSLRIGTIEPPLTLGYVLLPEMGGEVLKQQIENWPNVRHDDALDALELAYRTASTYKSHDAPQIVEGEVAYTGDGRVFAPTSKLTYEQAESLAFANDVRLAAKEGRPVPEEMWQPVMRY